MSEHICPCSCLCFCEGVEQRPDLGCQALCSAARACHDLSTPPAQPDGEASA